MPLMPLMPLPLLAAERVRVEPYLEAGMFIFVSPFIPGIDGISFIPVVPFILVMPFMPAMPPVGGAAPAPIPGIPAMLFALDALPTGAFELPGMDLIPDMSAIAPCPDAAAAAVPPLMLPS